MQKARLLNLWRPRLYPVRHYMYPRKFIQFLRNQPQPQLSQLENGLTIATLQRECCHAAIGIFADSGSRFENDFEYGISHLFEHLVFKSTRTTPREELQKHINSLGIKLRASTSRDMLSYCAECLAPDIDATVALLASCVSNFYFSDEEICREKYVVYEELLKQESDPRALVFDYLHATAFQGTGLANSVMGPSKNLYSVTGKLISQYLNRIMHPCRTCIIAVGCVSHEHIECLAAQYLSRCVPRPCFETIYRYTGSDVRYRNDDMPMAHVAFALEGPPFSDKDSVYIDLACSIIGGWDKSQHGGEHHAVAVARRASGGEFCDAYKAFNIKYKDTSLFGAQFIATSLQHEDMLYTLQDIMLGMSSMITEGEFERGKENMKSKILYDMQSCYGVMMDLGRHMLYNWCHWPTIHDRLDFIDRIQIDDFKKTMYEYTFNKSPVVAAIGPTEGLPDYSRISASMYWVRL